MVNSSDENIYSEIIEIIDQGGAAALATVVAKEGTSPREVGSKLLVREDRSFTGSVGGGAVESAVLKASYEVILAGEPRLVRVGDEEGEASRCCGVLQVYIEPILGAPTLCVCGAGHVGQYVAQVGSMAGFRVMVADDREELTGREHFPQADEILVGPVPQILDGLVLGPHSYIVIVRGHEQDHAILRWAVQTPARYIGMIGSEAKVKSVLDALEGEGVGRDRLDQVRAPIGMRIGAETPQEIAVAIMAEVISARRRKG
ncbi:MAG: XdhC/CoxI family protein [Dehalococcoidia bacterium]|nr:XdhC/CoxI family protein [Dehalococcoidia bacterium]